MRFNRPEKVIAPTTLSRYHRRHADAENIIAERLRDMQRRAALSDKQLSERTGIPPNDLRRMKRTGELNIHKANLLAHAFGKDVCPQGIQNIIGKPNRYGFAGAYRED